MSHLARSFTLAAAASLAIAAPASAGRVLAVGGDRVTPVDDPALPATDLSLPPSGSCAPPRTSAPPPAALFARSGRSVRAILRADYRRGALTGATYRRYRSIYDRARSTARRLSGRRRAELASVVRTLDGIAGRGSLTVSRMPALFFQLDHNVRFWPSKPLPHVPAPTPSPCRFFARRSRARAAGYVTPVRYVFKDSPVIFQYYPGQGLQIQPLANFGKANALALACQGAYGPNAKCRLDELRRMLDALVGLSSQRAGYTTWEYWFYFGGGRPPWTSGLSQGTAIQALTAGSRLLGEPRYLRVARDALGAFDKGPPGGVRIFAFGGSWYIQYSFDTRLLVLNGFLQSLNGIFDFAKATGDSHARALFAAGDRAAQRAIPRYDTGAWSLYSLNGRESDLGYHDLVLGFLKGLCERTGATMYCRTAQRFADYRRQHVRMTLLGAPGARARRAAAVRFWISKVSCVGIRITRGGKTVYGRRLQFGRGTHGFLWRPGGAGRYRVRLEAIDYWNHHTIVTGTVAVRG